MDNNKIQCSAIVYGKFDSMAQRQLKSQQGPKGVLTKPLWQDDAALLMQPRTTGWRHKMESLDPGSRFPMKLKCTVKDLEWTELDTDLLLGERHPTTMGLPLQFRL